MDIIRFVWCSFLLRGEKDNKMLTQQERQELNRLMALDETSPQQDYRLEELLYKDEGAREMTEEERQRHEQQLALVRSQAGREPLPPWAADILKIVTLGTAIEVYDPWKHNKHFTARVQTYNEQFVDIASNHDGTKLFALDQMQGTVAVMNPNGRITSHILNMGTSFANLARPEFIHINNADELFISDETLIKRFNSTGTYLSSIDTQNWNFQVIVLGDLVIIPFTTFLQFKNILGQPVTVAMPPRPILFDLVSKMGDNKLIVMENRLSTGRVDTPGAEFVPAFNVIKILKFERTAATQYTCSLVSEFRISSLYVYYGITVTNGGKIILDGSGMKDRGYLTFEVYDQAGNKINQFYGPMNYTNPRAMAVLEDDTLVALFRPTQGLVFFK
jgi:hypothetical protein